MSVKPPTEQRAPSGDVRDARTPAPVQAWRADTPRGRGAAPLSLGQVLVGAQQFVAQQTGAFMTQDQWRAVVGERIAQNTRVGRLRDGVLQIKVSSSAWCSELSFLKADLLARLTRAGREVKDLRFQVSEGTQKPKRRSTRVALTATADAPVELPPELQARLAKIEDGNLRAAIAEAALHSLRHQARK